LLQLHLIYLMLKLRVGSFHRLLRTKQNVALEKQAGGTCMSDDKISYPIDNMSATTQSLRSFLSDQWQQHTSLFMNRPASYHNLLTGISSVFASASGQAGEMSEAVTNYHQQYEKIYSAFHDLAGLIDQASQHMEATDHEIEQGFNGKAE
jgi:hypothetical protein